MSEMSDFDTWLGYGVKLGGSLGIIGVETTDGKIFNMGYSNHAHPISITSFRFGPGLGGGAGVVAIVVFNCGNLQNLQNTSTTDWSINFSLSGKWSAISKGLQKRKFFQALANIGGNLSKATPDDVTNLRNGLSYLYTAGEINGMDYSPKIVTIDIPSAGVGWEVSLNYLYGIITIGELIASEGSEEGGEFLGPGGDGGGSGAGA